VLGRDRVVVFLESLVVVRDGGGLSEARIKPYLLLQLPKHLASYHHGKEQKKKNPIQPPNP